MELKIQRENGEILGLHFIQASSLKDRMQGLMFRKELAPYDGMLIENCKSVHTFFMRFKIDLIFLNDDGIIIKIVRNISPYRLSGFYFSATRVLEVKGNTLSNLLTVGEKLEISCLS